MKFLTIALGLNMLFMGYSQERTPEEGIKEVIEEGLKEL
jgi:acyl CoA:acetate/3-ketoacid CoA transferase alpha subunit